MKRFKNYQTCAEISCECFEGHKFASCPLRGALPIFLPGHGGWERTPRWGSEEWKEEKGKGGWLVEIKERSNGRYDGFHHKMGRMCSSEWAMAGTLERVCPNWKRKACQGSSWALEGMVPLSLIPFFSFMVRYHDDLNLPRTWWINSIRATMMQGKSRRKIVRRLRIKSLTPI